MTLTPVAQFDPAATGALAGFERLADGRFELRNIDGFNQMHFKAGLISA